MSERRDDGGSVYPQYDFNPHSGQQYCIDPGMSLRDLFATRAPEQPMGWFDPAMDQPRPQTPEDEAGQFTHSMSGAQFAWDAEYQRRRQVEWPYAWADAQIKARSA